MGMASFLLNFPASLIGLLDSWGPPIRHQQLKAVEMWVPSEDHGGLPGLQPLMLQAAWHAWLVWCHSVCLSSQGAPILLHFFLHPSPVGPHLNFLWTVVTTERPHCTCADTVSIPHPFLGTQFNP
jgi:hypothetical protein